MRSSLQSRIGSITLQTALAEDEERVGAIPSHAMVCLAGTSHYMMLFLYTLGA